MEDNLLFSREFPRENQVCNYIFLLHHSVAGTRLKRQSKNKTNLWKGFCVLLTLIQEYLQKLSVRSL